MSIFFNGMNDDELFSLVEIMVNSGEKMDFSYLEKFTADKHSTGGVGDKVSLILAPLMAAAGLAIPMISGRGLGHTGGTLDKLESIPGFSVEMGISGIREQVARTRALETEPLQVGDIDALVALDELVGALKLSREAREASDKTGHALLSALRDVFEPQKLKVFESAIKSGRCAGHQAVIFGAAAGEFDLPEKDAVLSFLQAAVSNLAGVASRIIPLGQVETQRIILHAWPLLQQATRQARNTELHEMGSSMTSIDIASMKHERLHTRLCMS